MPTEKTIEVVTAIDVLTKKHGWVPSYRELMDYLGLKSTSTMQHRLKVAQYQGLIETGAKGSPRSLRITEEGRAWL